MIAKDRGQSTPYGADQSEPWMKITGFERVFVRASVDGAANASVNAPTTAIWAASRAARRSDRMALPLGNALPGHRIPRTAGSVAQPRVSAGDFGPLREQGRRGEGADEPDRDDEEGRIRRESTDRSGP